MLEENVRESKPYWISCDASWVRNHPSCQEIHMPTEWRRWGVAPEAAVVPRLSLNPKKTPIARFHLGVNRGARGFKDARLQSSPTSP
jgi:hypothetical protein